MAKSQLVGSYELVKRANGTGGDLTVASELSVSGVAFSGKLDSVAVAPAFSATSTYSVGDVVSRNGRLYRCETAIETAADWDATKWTETTVIAIITGDTNNGES